MSNLNTFHYPNLKEEERLFQEYISKKGLKSRFKLDRKRDLHLLVVDGIEYQSYQEFLVRFTNYIPPETLTSKRLRKKPMRFDIVNNSSTVPTSKRTN